jgi:D-glycero-D-manno-heptose 1,7-bisphosphate phosphatase
MARDFVRRDPTRRRDASHRGATLPLRGRDKRLRRAVFLDRDGVLNDAMMRERKPFSPASLAETRILPGVPEACTALKRAGFLLIVATNQPDIARGKADVATVDAINTYLKDALGLDAVMVCPHDDPDRCHCRKPKPGLLLDAAQRYGIDLTQSWMVGDRWRDVEAGRAAGCRTVFIDYGYDEKRPARADVTAGSLQEAAPAILR